MITDVSESCFADAVFQVGDFLGFPCVVLYLRFFFVCSAYILLLGSVLGSLVPLMSVSVLIVFWFLCLLFSFTFLCLIFTDFFCCCVSFPVSLVYVAQSGLCSVSLHHYPSHHASGS